MIELSIFIPTFNRENQFKRTFNRLKKVVNEEVEIIVGCSSSYIQESENHILFLDTRGYTREENYLCGLSNCRGVYTLIVEDDDIVSEEGINKFLEEEKNADLFIYGLMERKIVELSKKEFMSGEEFVDIFYERYKNTFQWGQCFTKTNLLKKAMYRLWVQDKVVDLIQSDELITLMIAKEAKTVAIFNYPLLWIGKGNDNYSWNNPREEEQVERFRQLRKKYIGK